MKRNRLLQTLAILELLAKGELNTTNVLIKARVDSCGLGILKTLVTHKILSVQRRKGFYGAPSNFFRLTPKGKGILSKWQIIKEMFGAKELSELV